jgi:hypothetical protein
LSKIVGGCSLTPYTQEKGSGQAARSIREQFVIEAFSPAKLARNIPDEEAPHDELSVGGGPGRS